MTSMRAFFSIQGNVLLQRFHAAAHGQIASEQSQNGSDQKHCHVEQPVRIADILPHMAGCLLDLLERRLRRLRLPNWRPASRKFPRILPSDHQPPRVDGICSATAFRNSMASREGKWLHRSF